MKIFITLFLSSITILLFMFDDTLSKKQTDKTYESIMNSFNKVKNSIEYKDNLGNLLLKNKNSEILIENDMILDSSILLDKDLKIIGNGNTIYIDNVMIPFFLSKNTKLVLENIEIKAINTRSFIASKGYGGEVELKNVSLHNIYGSTFKFYKVNTFFNNVKFVKNDNFVEQDNNFLFFSSCDKVSITQSNFYFNKSEQPPISFEEIKNLTFKNNNVETWVTGLFGSLHFWNIGSGDISDNTIEDKNDDRITVIDPSQTEDEDNDQLKEVSSYMQGSIAFSVMDSEGLDIKNNVLKTYNVIFDDDRYLSSEKINYIKMNNIIYK